MKQALIHWSQLIYLFFSQLFSPSPNPEEGYEKDDPLNPKPERSIYKIPRLGR